GGGVLFVVLLAWAIYFVIIVPDQEARDRQSTIVGTPAPLTERDIADIENGTRTTNAQIVVGCRPSAIMGHIRQGT
ncbi:MAG: hypothetical protein QGH15_23815, partial [Kiritimatiellia bacterium]|nr:hypothetical protein [Kiritimatiellia bacterium]